MEYNIVKSINLFGHGTILDSVTNFVSWIPFIIILWLAIGFYVSIKDKKRGKLVFLTIIIALAIHFIISEGLIKHYLANTFNILRDRPWVTHGDIIAIGNKFTDSSFPSSHMASTLSVLTVVVYYYRKTLIWALGFVLLMAFSRIHNGMHYPTDVIAGSLLGFGYGILAIYLVKFFKKKKST